MLGLHCCAEDFSPCSVQASHCSGFSGCRAQVPELAGFSSGIFPDQGWKLDPPLDHQGSPLFRFLAGFKFSALDRMASKWIQITNSIFCTFPNWKILKRDLGFSPGLVLQRSNAWVTADLEGTTYCKYVNVMSTIFGQHTKRVHLKCSGDSSRGFSGYLRGKDFTCLCRRCAGRPPGERNGNPFQCSCLGNPMARGDWQATAHVFVKSWIWLSDWTHTQRIFQVMIFVLPSFSHTLYAHLYHINHHIISFQAVPITKL